MIKYISLLILFLIISRPSFGQLSERYITKDCICSIAVTHDSAINLTPSHKDIDMVMHLIKKNDTLNDLADTSRYILSLGEYIFERHKTLWLYFYPKPLEDGMEMSDGQTHIFFDMETKTFRGRRIIEG